MTKHTILTALRLVLGLLILSAIGTQFFIHLRLGYSVVNFFSYFTNLSNLFAAIVLLVGAYRLATRRKPSISQDLIRGASAVNMAIVGIVFVVLLRNVPLGNLLPWVNTTLHYIMPVAVMLEWIFQPPTTKIRFKQMLLWQAFPLLYLVYVLIRGALVGWYPYPFLNPATVGGYKVVTVYIIAIVVLFLVVSWLVLTVGNKRSEYVTASE